MSIYAPEMPVWHARSFYASLLMAATVLANVLGFNLLGVLETVGLGSSDEEVLRNVQMLMPLVFGFWAWFERRAPNFRLVWRRVSNP